MRLRRQWWYPILTTLYSTVALYYCIMLQTGTAVAQWQQTVKERRRRRKERESCSCHATPCREPTMRKGMRERERESYVTKRVGGGGGGGHPFPHSHQPTDRTTVHERTAIQYESSRAAVRGRQLRAPTISLTSKLSPCRFHSFVGSFIHSFFWCFTRQVKKKKNSSFISFCGSFSQILSPFFSFSFLIQIQGKRPFLLFALETLLRMRVCVIIRSIHTRPFVCACATAPFLPAAAAVVHMPTTTRTTPRNE